MTRSNAVLELNLLKVTVGVGWWALAYNEKYFPNPEIFRPERYLAKPGNDDENMDAAKNNYWAFSMGPRKCPGMKMAYQELYITIARLVYLFDITAEDSREMEQNFELLDHFSKSPTSSFHAISE